MMNSMCPTLESGDSMTEVSNSTMRCDSSAERNNMKITKTNNPTYVITLDEEDAKELTFVLGNQKCSIGIVDELFNRLADALEEEDEDKCTCSPLDEGCTCKEK
jgi:hypothetical protein